MKNILNVYKKIDFKNPILITAWPGMGEVALRAAVFLKDKLKCEEFAEVDMPEFFPPTGVWIENSLIKVQKFSKGKFYYWKNKTGANDLIIFFHEAQPNLEKGFEYAQKIISVIKKFGVKKVITFAALPTSIDHTQRPGVWAAATNMRLVKELQRYNLKIMQTGQISGLNGLFLGAAKDASLDGVCLLGEIPLYTIQIENPKASLAVVNILSRMFGLQIDTKDLLEQAKYIEDEIGKLVDYLKGSVDNEPIGEEEIGKIKKMLAAYTKLPDSAKKEIEGLFQASQKDISQANKLKEMLDKWNVYKEYEDRFLDLFKKNKHSEN